MNAKNLLVPLLILTVWMGGMTACAPTSKQDASAAATIAAAQATAAAAEATKADAAQAIAQATQMAQGVPTATPAAGPSQHITPAPTQPPPPMPSPETCAEESDPFWHWQMGYVEVKDFFFTTSSVGFAVGEPNTLLRTEDGGNSWTAWPINSSQPLNAIYFIDQKTGWVAGDDGIILKATDGGLTWQLQQTGTKANLYVIKFIDDQTGWAGGSNGTLLRTTDGGASWSAGATGQQMDVVDIAFIDAQEGYLVGQVGLGPSNYVLHTSDGGATWQNTDWWGTMPETIYAAKGATPWLAGGWVSGMIWRGIGHDSKTKVTEIAKGAECRFRQIVFSDEQHGWAVGDCGLAILTQDGGQSWQPMEVHNDANWKMLRFTSEQDAVLAGYSFEDGIQVAHSSDGGKTWSLAPSKGSPSDSLDVHDVDFVDAWFGWAVVAEWWDGPTDLFITRDGGQSWEKNEALGGQVRQIQFVDRLRGWAIGKGGLVARSDDSGRTWEIQSIPFPEALEAVSFVDRDHGWVISGKIQATGVYPEECGFDRTCLALFRTASGGDQWEGPVYIQLPQMTGFPQSPPNLQFVDRDTGWIAAAEGIVLKTTDGGLTWQQQIVGTAVELTDVHFVDAQTGWVTGDNGVLLETTDGGEHWKQQRLGSNKLTGIRFVSKQTGWVASTDPVTGKVFHTSDGGRTWQAKEFTFYPYYPQVTLDAIDENHVWVGATGSRGGITAYAPVCLSSLVTVHPLTPLVPLSPAKRERGGDFRGRVCAAAKPPQHTPAPLFPPSPQWGKGG